MAEEVRTLAEKRAEAVKDITALIAQSTESVDSEVVVVEETAASLGEVQAAITEVIFANG